MKERTKIRIGALIAAILLAGLCMAFGQTVSTFTCYTENGDVDTVILKKGKEMMFVSVNKKDTTVVWIEGMYSKNDNENIFYIKVKYPKSIDASCKNGLQIDLVDIGRIEFEGGAYRPSENTCAYKLMDNEVMSLSIRGYDLICFTSPKYIRPTTYSTIQRPFVDFFVNYYK